MTLTYKHSREALERVFDNLLELNSESPIRNTLIHNDFDCTEDLVNISDTDIQNLRY